MTDVLAEGRNCWRIARAARMAILVDGEDYFRAVRAAMCRAQRSIFVIGWDVHSGLKLVRDGSVDDGFPVTLGPLLEALARDRPDLGIHVLEWDFAMIYAMEREFFPRYRLPWLSHRRVHFRLDGEHPLGASQHQKVVVVDDRVAFAGGLDLGKWRWDRSEHLPDDPRREDPDGESYAPFHDVQWMVDGEAAASLGQLARERWRGSGGDDPGPPANGTDLDPWPPDVEPDVGDVDVGIARTLPAYRDREAVREVERLYLDAIAAADRAIYIENQYFSSHEVGRALAGRLEEPDGPEVVVVLPEHTGGWLERHTMDVLRARVLASLREADRHDRLRVYLVRLGQDPPVSLMIHAKVLIVDDRLARVGSSNLSNRSMGLDSECDLVIESNGSDDLGKTILGFRRRLLAEHLGVDIAAVRDAECRHDSLIRAIESLRGGTRTFEPLSFEVPPELDHWVPDADLLDPEKPVEPEELLDTVVDSEDRRPFFRRTFGVAAGLLIALGATAAWRWTPLADWLDIESLTAAGRWVEAQPFTPLLVLAIYVIAGIAVVPILLLFLATMIVFGPWTGSIYAILGAEVSAMATFAVGHLLGRDTVRRLVGSRFNRINRKLSERGILATVTLRILPVAPFSILNGIAGISDIRARDFAIGNVVGIIPGVVASAVMTDRIVATLREPTGPRVIVLVGVAAAIALGLYGLRSWIRRRGGSRTAP